MAAPLNCRPADQLVDDGAANTFEAIVQKHDMQILIGIMPAVGPPARAGDQDAEQTVQAEREQEH